MSDKYLVTVNRVSPERLRDDKLSITMLPEALNTATENLAPKGSLDLELVYLLTAEQCDRAVAALEQNSTPYPRGGNSANAENVVDLNSRRKPDPA
jgi:hypothetical protein